MEYYHRENKFNLEKIPPTSPSIHKYIQRAFLQSHIWYNSYFRKIPFLDPLDYGYVLINEVFMPGFKTQIVPEDFLLPCSCQKCAKENVCPCRKLKISCCKFGKCQRHSSCKTPENQRRIYDCCNIQDGSLCDNS